jgi:hypothetical protein
MKKVKRREVDLFMYRKKSPAGTFFKFWIVRLLALRPLLADCTSLGCWWRGLWRSSWNGDWQVKPKFSENNLPQRHFCPSQNPTWLEPGLNPGRRGGKHATSRLSYGAALAGTWRIKGGLATQRSGSPLATQRFGKQTYKCGQLTVGAPLLSSWLLRFIATEKTQIIARC